MADDEDKDGKASVSCLSAPGTMHDAGDVPRILLIFTCWVCTGIMANFTLIMPLTIYFQGHELNAAGVVSSYAIGALLSLTFWSTYNRHAVRSAYLTHATVMVLGNLLFALGAINSRAWTTQYLARFVVGLEGGCMYNANLALIGFSSRANRVKYLSYYQSFVGVGLVLGPAISATAILAAYAIGHPDMRSAFAGAFMCAWGIILLVSLLVFMPHDSEWSEQSPVFDKQSFDEPLDESSSQSPYSPRTIWFFSYAGNFWRIFQRLAWEVGAVLILARYFHWGSVAAGFSLSFFGGAQAVAQFAYGQARTKSIREKHQGLIRDLKLLELCELLGILAMFSKTPATHDSRIFFNVTFILASLIFYLSSCLTSAPFNDIVLSTSVRKLAYEEVLLASQYGIFSAFLAAPIAARGAFTFDAVAPSTIVGVLIVGWACQSLVNTALVRHLDSALVAGLGFGLSGLIVWASFDRGAGGTGWPSVFTYHPIFMAWAFYGCMTPGQLVYRDDALILRFFPGNAKAEYRKSHAVWMALSSLFAFVGYWCIFAAHAQNGESQIGIGESWSRTLHVALGYPALIWFVVQTAVGAIKANRLNTTGIRSYPWHGASGKYLLLFGYIVSSLGFWLRMNYGKQGGWSIPLKLLFTAIALALFGYRALPDEAIGVKRPAPTPSPSSGDLVPDAGVPPAKDVL